ncbi:DUF342 domain-containing protein [Bacillus sp. HMF5848]|uniref:DUF342 domain-containing protein n=1 Tax=Bacillus sp. HMF5848 TaxID=2495421 RepID=UPI000F77E913|nr:FapA family protein [Bacillus sp. HMF5848]RSK28303.1 DUF342 domain-containing protein [Bacillus sp. HMF5848]
MELINNDYFQIVVEDDSVYIYVTKVGFPLTSFNDILQTFPRLCVTNFLKLKHAIDCADNTETLIGLYKPLVSCKVSKDKMTAHIHVNATDEEFAALQQQNQLIPEIMTAIEDANIIEGIQLKKEDIIPRQDILIAQGTPPTNGEDAIVRYFQLSDRKPSINESGDADFYQMNFIDEVEQGDWLGEKVPPTEGLSGITVIGEELLPKKGKDKRLLYDPKSVELVEQDSKSVLFAKINGVVSRIGGKISVANHLRIEGDVGMGTGNIEFDGSITITGTVQEGFSVVAGVDISILSELGIRKVGKIESLQGDIYIKGGVFGPCVIQAKKNVYVKHANECTITAEKDINIGFYSVASTLTAENVLTHKGKGRIIGGKIMAKGKVYASQLGNKAEKRTIIYVEGFDRKQIQKDLQLLLTEYKTAIDKYETIARHLEIYESFAHNLNDSQQEQYNQLKQAFDCQYKEISKLEDYRLHLQNLLQIKGEGEITIDKQAFPETIIEIRNMSKRINNLTRGTFYALGKELKFE